jgi:hypothetical protein
MRDTDMPFASCYPIENPPGLWLSLTDSPPPRLGAVPFQKRPSP